MIHKLKPQAICYWVEPQQKFSHLQTRKYTPVRSFPHAQPLTKTSFSAFTWKIATNLMLAQRKVFKSKHILLRNTNGWMLQNQAYSVTAHTTFIVRTELHCSPAEAQHVRFLLPRLVEKKLAPCASPMKGNISRGLHFRLKNMASEN